MHTGITAPPVAILPALPHLCQIHLYSNTQCITLAPVVFLNVPPPSPSPCAHTHIYPSCVRSSCQSHLGRREGRRGRGKREGGSEGGGGRGREGGRKERKKERGREGGREGGREEGRGYPQEHASCEVLAMYLITQVCMAGGGGKGYSEWFCAVS